MTSKAHLLVQALLSAAAVRVINEARNRADAMAHGAAAAALQGRLAAQRGRRAAAQAAVAADHARARQVPRPGACKRTVLVSSCMLETSCVPSSMRS